MARTSLTDEYDSEPSESYLYEPCPGVYDRHGEDPTIPQVCRKNGEFSALCCQHKHCHWRPAVFVDGACLGNGSVNARSGYAVVWGVNEDQAISISIDASEDPCKPRSNQRAELLATLQGVRVLKELKELDQQNSRGSDNQPCGARPEYLVATDSEYVVKGITQWMPKWEVRR